MIFIIDQHFYVIKRQVYSDKYTDWFSKWSSNNTERSIYHKILWKSVNAIK